MLQDETKQEKVLYRFGKYEVTSHIATGGMGAVYRAVDRELGRDVAIKILTPEAAARPAILKRFRREAQTAAKLLHPNVVTLYEFGEHEGTYFLVMELVDGINLHDFVQSRGPFPPSEALEVMIQIVDALDHAHQCGIVHRDIKPSNILITTKQGRLLAKLTDLGVARFVKEEEFRVTRDGCTVGTVDYMSPEQARNSQAADIRSDIYSLGCTVYQMLAGRPPFPEGTLPERIFKHAEAEPIDVRQHNPAVPEGLWLIIRRMLAKQSVDRFQTPADLLRELSRLSTELGAHAGGQEVGTDPDILVPDSAAKAALGGADGRRSAAPGSDEHDETALAEDPSPASAEQRRLAQGLFDRAAPMAAPKDLPERLQLLRQCCQIEPTRLEYREALRDTFHNCLVTRRPWLPTWLKALLPKLRLKLSFNDPLKVLQLGEEVLAWTPGDVPTHLAMAEAARNCGFVVLEKWLLNHARTFDRHNVQVNRAQAYWFEKRQNYRRAIDFWEKVRKVDPINREAINKIRDLLARETLVRGHYEQWAEHRALDESDDTPPPSKRKPGDLRASPKTSSM